MLKTLATMRCQRIVCVLRSADELGWVHVIVPRCTETIQILQSLKPLALFISILQVTTKFPTPCLLQTCPRKASSIYYIFFGNTGFVTVQNIEFHIHVLITTCTQKLFCTQYRLLKVQRGKAGAKSCWCSMEKEDELPAV